MIPSATAQGALPEGLTSDWSDEALVQAIGRHDEAALSTLYRRYVPGIYRFILAQVRVECDAEDLTSETFARMLHSLAEFRQEASFKNWLYQIARNAVRNHRRSAHYRLNLPLGTTLASAGDESGEAEDKADAGATQERVLALLAPLPPRYRQVLELRFLTGLPLDEVARRMGITVGNAKVLQHRALAKAAAVGAQPTEERTYRDAPRVEEVSRL